MQLRAFYLVPGVSFVPGVGAVVGYGSSLNHWDRDKHALLKCEEQKNGDIWLTPPDGRRREISALVIAYRVRDPDVAKPSEPVRRNVEHQVPR